MKELDAEDFDFEPVICDGIDKCRQALMRANKGALSGNFIEGMACVGGCVGGTGNLIRYVDSPKKMEEHIVGARAVEILPNVRKTINIL